VPDRTVTIAMPGAGDVAFRVLDSGDACDRANEHFQEVLCWISYITRFHELYYPRAESRTEQLEMGALMAMPVLMAHGLDAETAEKAGQDLAEEVLDRLLPANIDAAREPGPTTFARLARAMENRRRALRKLLDELAIDAAKDVLDTFIDGCRDWGAATQVLDTLMTGDTDDADPGPGAGDGPHGRPDDPPGPDAGDQPEEALPGPGGDPGDQPSLDPPGTLDHGRDAGPHGRAPDGGDLEAPAEPVRPADATDAGGAGDLAGPGEGDQAPPEA
jgi:hypothetical protein